MGEKFTIEKFRRMEDFYNRLAKHFERERMESDIHFHRKVFYNYQNPTGRFIPPIYKRGEWWSLSEKERKRREKEYHLELLQKWYDDAKELSGMHNVRF